MISCKYRAWNGEIISQPFYPWELEDDVTGGKIDRNGVSVWWKSPDFAGENWMQFTGLRDKYGTEIYRDDYVKQGTDIFQIIACVGSFECLKVVGGDKGSTFIFACLSSKHCKVLGNIHQHKHLLESK